MNHQIWISASGNDLTFYNTKLDALNDVLNIYIDKYTCTELIELRDDLFKDDVIYYEDYIIYKSNVVKKIILNFDLCQESSEDEDDISSEDDVFSEE